MTEMTKTDWQNDTKQMAKHGKRVASASQN